MPQDEIPTDPKARTAWVIAAVAPDEIARRYNLWATQYEDDLLNVDGYLAPFKTADYCERWIGKDAVILDAACGTGLSGKAFYDKGWHNLTGLDFAAQMLALAQKTPYYQKLIEADLGAVLPFVDNSFDAVIKIGGSPVPPVCFHEFARITRANGHIFYCGSIAAYNERGFGKIAQSYVDSGDWQPLPLSGTFPALPESAPNIIYQIIGFEVLR